LVRGERQNPGEKKKTRTFQIADFKVSARESHFGESKDTLVYFIEPQFIGQDVWVQDGVFEKKEY